MPETQRSRPWLVPALSLPVALALGLVIAIDLTGREEPNAGNQFSHPRVGMTEYDVADRVKLPPLEGVDLDGEVLSTTDFSARAMVLNVWGSWCGPCRAEAPDLVAVAADYPDVQFVGIDTRDNPASAQAFVRRFEIPYPSWDDADGAILADLSGLVPVSAVPSTLVIDAGGMIGARVIGQVDDSTLRGLLDDITDSAERQ